MEPVLRRFGPTRIMADFLVDLASGPAAMMSMRWRDDRALVPPDGSPDLEPVQMGRRLATALFLLTSYEDPKLYAVQGRRGVPRSAQEIALPVDRLSVVSARPLKRRSRRSMGSTWSLTLRADSGEVGEMWGDWLTLAWLGSRASWPEPPTRPLG